MPKKRPLQTVRQQDLTRGNIIKRLPPMFRMIDQHLKPVTDKNYRALTAIDLKLFSTLLPYALSPQQKIDITIDDQTKQPHEVLAGLRETLGNDAVDLIVSMLSGKQVITQPALENLETH
ncbi:MAG: hypothetical protein IME93_03140 [Proteobacteria bacterium]|nr:hypothetical protein [Pseudomonadota bacterium]